MKLDIYGVASVTEELTFGKFMLKTAMIAMVAEQTNAAELESPDPTIKQEVEYPLIRDIISRHYWTKW